MVGYLRIAVVLTLFAPLLGVRAASAAPLEANVVARVTPSEARQIEHRREELFAEMMADPSNLDSAFEYAALSAKVGDIEGAISTLERMLIFAPGLPRLQVELGVLYFRLGAYAQAAGYFEEALKGQVPPAAQARVEAYLKIIDKRSQTNVIDGVTLFGGRYQSNANGAPSSQDIDLEDFGPDASVSLGVKPKADANAFASGRFTFSHDLESQGDRLVATLATYSAIYADRSELDTGLAEVTIGPAINMQRFRVDNSVASFYAIAGGAVIAGDIYRVSGGAGASLIKEFAPGTELTFKAEFRYQDYENSDLQPRASDRTGDRYNSSATLQHQVWERFSILVGVAGERGDVEVDYLSLWEAGARLGATWVFDSPIAELELPWSFVPVVGYKFREHDEPEFPLGPQPRQDQEAYVLGTLTVPFNEVWALQASASYRDVSSNYDLNDFNNISGSLAVMRRF